VTSPTYFQLLYKDPALTINPTTAGTYSYTFNVIPSGVTLSSLNAKGVMTYRHATNSGCPDGSSINQRMKTEQFFIASFPSQVSSATSSPFSVYIGDDLTSVTSPLKSMYYLISGIYTGNGTVEFQIDADVDTSRVFTLPTVTSPTYFQLLYKDPALTINPTTAGTYSYTFNVIPSGVTLSSLSVKTAMTYQYAPPTCTPTGELYSVVFDTTGSDVDGPSYNSLSWKGSLNTGKVRLKFATAASSTGPWSYLGPEPGCDTVTSTDADWYVPDVDTPMDIGCFSSHEGQRYFRYELQICKATDCTSTAGMTSPTVTDVIINWSP
jgi:hypothetical protein